MARSNKNRNKNVSRNENFRKGFETEDRDIQSEGKQSSEAQAKKRISQSTNNIEWWAADETLLKNSATLAFSEPFNQGDTGSSYNVRGQDVYARYSWSPAGVCTLKTAPCFGASTDSDSPLNVAMQALYIDERKHLSGAANYDHTDLSMYILAMTGAYQYINFVQRAYGLQSFFPISNQYIPDTLLRIQGIDPEDLESNRANLREWLNVYIKKVAAYPVPGFLQILNREVFLYQNVYCESQYSIKDQLYMFIPDGFHRFALDGHGAGFAEYVQWDYNKSNLASVQDLIDFGNALFRPIFGDQDASVIGGDLLKAYPSSLITLVTLPDEYQIVPIYDEMVLTQIKNAVVMPYLNRTSLNVTQDENGVLICTPYTTLNLTEELNEWELANVEADIPLTIDSALPSPAEIMEATRLSATVAESPASTPTMHYLDTGTDIVVGCVLYGYFRDLTTGELELMAKEWNSHTRVWETTDNTKYLDYIQRFVFGSQFKYAPLARVWYTVPSTAATNPSKMAYRGIFGSLDNHTYIQPRRMRSIHRAALMNALAVPTLNEYLKR